MACFEKYHPDDTDSFQCPNCGAVGVKIVAGEEFSLEAIDVE
jgi:Zn finger protein HypA/HybF involved in hydrogenase expression